MGKINVLESQVAQLIAAGEVVERPGAVVKELIENSIDAGATAIRVEIRNGGNTYIRVSDNGCGILREDCPAAFMPHATSKVKNAEDLYNISTLGFRGEALPSVATVSKVELLTKPNGEALGTRFVIYGGDIMEFEDAGCADGTVITVCDLFYNTPARLKFMKKDVAEGNYIAQIIDRLALSHPEISFRFIREGKEQLHTPGDNKLISAIYAVLGSEFAEDLTEVNYKSGKFEVTGYVCPPNKSRKNRNMQIFFLNGRYIKSNTFTYALEQAYKDNIMQGRFPAGVLYIKMPHTDVDVNVHPAKTEVRFSDEKEAFSAVYYAVKTALSENSGNRREIDFPQNKFKLAQPALAIPKTENTGFVSMPAADFIKENKDDTASAEYKTLSPLPFTVREKPTEEPKEAYIQPQKTAEVWDNSVTPQLFRAEKTEEVYKYIGEIFNTYMIVTKGNDMFLVDKHALHERAIYDRLRRGEETFSQPFLTPVSVNLTKEEKQIILDNREGLLSKGIDAEDFGTGTVIVRSMPLHMTETSAVDVIHEIAEKLKNNPLALETDKSDWIYHSVACRAAIKAGHKSSPEELINLLKSIDNIEYCPHGRPVTVKISKAKIEKEFGRTE